ncbi:MAG: hypothetical protein K2P81_09835 [Bacteriovoracaceae bacterium]|nr:hypothetical protein [Bacteriovoracaceae bacterium]
MIFLVLNLFFHIALAQVETVQICNKDNVKTYDIVSSNDATSHQLFYAIYEPLFSISGADTKPLLAEKIESNPANDEWTVTLKKNIAFHRNAIFKPTRLMNAKDVVYSFNRQMRTGDYAKDEEFTFDYFDQHLAAFLKSVEAVDDSTVKFKLKIPHPKFDLKISNVAGAIYSLEYYEFLKSKGKIELLNLMPIGTGPWQIFSQTHASSFELVANPRYHQAPQKFGIRFISEPVDERLIEKIKSKMCDWVNSPSALVKKELRTLSNWYNSEMPSPSVSHLLVNNNNHELKDKTTRSHLIHCLDPNSLIKKSNLESITEAKNILPVTDRFYYSKYPPHIPQRASSQAHFKSKTIPKLNLIYPKEPRPYMPEPEVVATELVRQLELCGLKVNMTPMPIVSLTQLRADESYDLLLFGDTETGFDLVTSFLSCGPKKDLLTYTGHCNEEFEILVEKNRSNYTPTPDELRDMSLKLRTTFSYLPLGWLKHEVAINDKKKDQLLEIYFFQRLREPPQN